MKDEALLFGAELECIKRIRHLEISSFEHLGRGMSLMYTLFDLKFLETLTLEVIRDSWRGRNQGPPKQIRTQFLEGWANCQSVERSGQPKFPTIIFINEEESNTGQA